MAVQGYDYLVSSCVQKCEVDLLRKNPFYVQLQEGGYKAQNYCRDVCSLEYNKNEQPYGGSFGGPYASPVGCSYRPDTAVKSCYNIRKIPYNTCPLQESKLRYRPYF